MKRKNMFDLLENSDEGELGMIDRLTPELSDEQFERILEKSKRKRHIMRAAKGRNIDMSSYGETENEVEGVEDYKSPVWRRFMATAASLILISGGIALCHNLLRRSGDNVQEAIPDIAVQVTTVNTASDECEKEDAATVTADVNAEVKDEAANTDTAENTAVPAAEGDINVNPAQENKADAQPATSAPPVQSQDTQNTVTNDNSGLTEAARRLTDDYSQLYSIKWGWLRTTDGEPFTVRMTIEARTGAGEPTVSDIEKVYSPVAAPYNNVENIRAFLRSHCTENFYNPSIYDIDEIAEKTGEREYTFSGISSGMPYYFIKDGEVYCTPAMMGYDFGGWTDMPIEISDATDDSFKAVRTYYSDFDHSVTADVEFLFAKDRVTGEWLINTIVAGGMQF